MTTTTDAINDSWSDAAIIKIYDLLRNAGMDRNLAMFRLVTRRGISLSRLKTLTKGRPIYKVA